MPRWWKGTISDTGSDTSQNGKLFSVPASRVWHLLWIWVEVTTSDTAATRQIVADIMDSDDNVISQFRPGATQAESLTRYYHLYPGAADMDAFRDTDFLTTPIPGTLILEEGTQIKVYDNSTADADSDVFDVRLGVNLKGEHRPASV